MGLFYYPSTSTSCSLEKNPDNSNIPLADRRPDILASFAKTHPGSEKGKDQWPEIPLRPDYNRNWGSLRLSWRNIFQYNHQLFSGLSSPGYKDYPQGALPPVPPLSFCNNQ